MEPGKIEIRHQKMLKRKASSFLHYTWTTSRNKKQARLTQKAEGGTERRKAEEESIKYSRNEVRLLWGGGVVTRQVVGNKMKGPYYVVSPRTFPWRIELTLDEKKVRQRRSWKRMCRIQLRRHKTSNNPFCCPCVQREHFTFWMHLTASCPLVSPSRIM